MKTLVITNDYFPKKGGISTYIKSFENHLEFEKKPHQAKICIESDTKKPVMI